MDSIQLLVHAVLVQTELRVKVVMLPVLPAKGVVVVTQPRMELLVPAACLTMVSTQPAFLALPV